MRPIHSVLSTTLSFAGSLPSLPSDITFEICGSSTPPPPQRMNDNDYAEDFDDSDSTSINSSSAPQPHEEQHQQTVISRIGDELPAKSGADAEGVHFLSASAELRPCKEPEEPAQEPEPEVRKQLLEYLIQKDGSVVCKWCGEVLPSRTRWYRHKYKLHVSSANSNHQVSAVSQPAPLFKCASCNAYFKSRKGYIGHLSSRHSTGATSEENDENREEPLLLQQQPASNGAKGVNAATTLRKGNAAVDIGRGPDWEQQREKEEKLVADIIDRVKRECEAQGETVTRRGYSRRSTVMNS